MTKPRGEADKKSRSQGSNKYQRSRLSKVIPGIDYDVF